MKTAPIVCLVTGGSGFVGQRLVEMLVERGAKKVISFDISPKPKDALESAKIQYVQGDLTNLADVTAGGWFARGGEKVSKSRGRFANRRGGLEWRPSAGNLFVESR